MAPLQIDTETRQLHEQFLPQAGGFVPDPIVRTNRDTVRLRSQEKPRRLRVALAGCGVVGGGLVRLLHESAAALASRFDLQVDLTGVLVRDVDRDRNLPIDRRLLTNDLADFLSRDFDVIVEAVGGDEPARTIASHTLRCGKKFITANKDLVASHGVALSLLAHENSAGLDFGAAVGGSAPVISTLRDLLGTSTPKSVRGILNGTSNYVISQVERGVSFDAALGTARARGLAESDCSRDLDGRDAAAKLAIIAWIAYGIRPAALQVRRTPLPADLQRLVRCASLVGGHLRLIAECRVLTDDEVAASVEPVIVAANSGFGRTVHEDNRVEVDLGWGVPVSVSGPGAGSRPTATALLADLLGVARPRNERGNGGMCFSSAPDLRRHRWLVSALVPPDRLDSLVTASARLDVARRVFHDQFAALITRPAAWADVQRLITTLEGVGAEPSVARCEMAGEGEEELQ